VTKNSQIELREYQMGYISVRIYKKIGKVRIKYNLLKMKIIFTKAVLVIACYFNDFKFLIFIACFPQSMLLSAKSEQFSCTYIGHCKYRMPSTLLALTTFNTRMRNEFRVMSSNLYLGQIFALSSQ
jgi:hypothetical protein